MNRSHRSVAWSLILVLLYASFALAQKPPAAQAAAQVFYVNTATDPFPAPTGSCGVLVDPQTDVCSLRTAILKANSAPAADLITIQFQIPQGAAGYLSEIVGGVQVQTWTMKLTQPLDFITHDNVTIDGFSQAQFIGFNPNPFGPEIIVDGSLQTQTGGLTFQSSNNTVKGLGIINFQTTGGFIGVGIEFRPLGGNLGTNNKVQGCFIGIDRLGVNPAPNTIGIWLRTDNNQVGGDSTTSDQYNIISGNINDGVLIEGSGNKVQGNIIGLNATASSAVGNHGNGVTIRIANGNLIGAPTTAFDARNRNIISGNFQQGIQVFNGQNNEIYGNLVGVGGTGAGSIPNRGDGVLISSSGGQTKNNIVGGTNFFNRNTLSGNGGAGLHIQGDNTSNNFAYNNLIGPASTGLAVPTGTFSQTGVLIDQGADGNQIGGSAAGQPNVISGNKGDGVHIEGFVFAGPPPTVVQSNDNKIVGNLIGLNRLGTLPLPNNGNGIAIASNVNRTTIGGPTVADRNQILNNLGHGISISGTPVLTTTVLKNTIQSNTGNGILVSGATNTRIDGGDGAGANTIATNGANGIQVTNSLTTTILFNTVNSNVQNGVQVSGATTKFTTISNTTLNTNQQNGVLVDTGALNTTITSNTIYTNTLNGVFVQGGASSPQRVKIIDNSMQGNLKGIELNPETSSPQGNQSNPNHDIDPPFNLHIDQTGRLSGKIRLTPTNPAISACAQPCTIQVFSTNPQTLDRQGRDKINVTPPIVPDSPDTSVGTFTASIGSVPAQLALTATDKDGNTSEFAVITRTFGLDIGPPQSGLGLPSQVITYTHRITNTGSVDFTNIQLGVIFTTTYLGVVSSQPWPYNLLPLNTPPITLLAGQSKPVTLTMTLPSGSDSSVRAGLIQQARVTASAITANPAVVTTASVTDTTTVGESFLLDATPLTRSGVGAPDSANSVVPYVHTLTNIGNVAGTVLVSAVTDRAWDTTVSTDTVKLAPGEAKNVTISVAIPSGTAANSTPAITTVTLMVPDTPSQNKTLTDTTAVELTPSALLIHTGEADAEAGAGETTSFLYKVENRSNGTATFSLSGLPSFGGTSVTFKRLDGQQFGPGNSFTLSNVEGSNELQFVLEVKLDSKLLVGDVETVTILLLDDQNRTRAAAQDRITIKRTAFVPRLYLPLVSN